MFTGRFFQQNLLLGLLFLGAASAMGQAPTAEERRQGPPDGRGQPLFGKITAIGKGTLELSKLPDGGAVTVKLTDKTDYRKDRQSAKLEDFKVGDLVMVRADDSGGPGVTALMVAGRTGGGPGVGGLEGRAMGGPGSGGFSMLAVGEMGKDYVFGEVKSIDAPQITIARPDNVTQTLELTEETSLRKGRDSVTMADIQVGDHVFVRGATQNNVFVPKAVMVIGPEQWKRMQDMGVLTGGNKPTGDGKPNPPQQ